MPDSSESTYDVVVIGGGTAGCVLASRLSENSARKILLLEAGPGYPPDQYPEDLISVRNIGFGFEPVYNWGYLSVPGSIGHSITAYAARVLGGGSAINAGIARRARPVARGLMTSLDGSATACRNGPIARYSRPIRLWKAPLPAQTAGTDETVHGRFGRLPLTSLRPPSELTWTVLSEYVFRA